MSSQRKLLRDANEKVMRADRAYCSADEKYQHARSAYMQIAIEGDSADASKKALAMEKWKEEYIALMQANRERIEAETALAKLIGDDVV